MSRRQSNGVRWLCRSISAGTHCSCCNCTKQRYNELITHVPTWQGLNCRAELRSLCQSCHMQGCMHCMPLNKDDVLCSMGTLVELTNKTSFRKLHSEGREVLGLQAWAGCSVVALPWVSQPQKCRQEQPCALAWAWTWWGEGKRTRVATGRAKEPTDCLLPEVKAWSRLPRPLALTACNALSPSSRRPFLSAALACTYANMMLQQIAAARHRTAAGRACDATSMDRHRTNSERDSTCLSCARGCYARFAFREAISLSTADASAVRDGRDKGTLNRLCEASAIA